MTNLVYLNNRYHDPTLGMFVSVDPLVVQTGESYIYGSANPIAYSDPSGLCTVSKSFCDANDTEYAPTPEGVRRMVVGDAVSKLATLTPDFSFDFASGRQRYSGPSRSEWSRSVERLNLSESVSYVSPSKKGFKGLYRSYVPEDLWRSWEGSCESSDCQYVVMVELGNRMVSSSRTSYEDPEWATELSLAVAPAEALPGRVGQLATAFQLGTQLGSLFNRVDHRDDYVVERTWDVGFVNSSGDIEWQIYGHVSSLQSPSTQLPGDLPVGKTWVWRPG